MKKVDKEYLDFLEQKKQQRIESGFSIKEKDLNPLLFPFQKYCVKRALEVGKFAMFEDCGLGKTIQQLEWAKHVCNHIYDRSVPEGKLTATYTHSASEKNKVEGRGCVAHLIFIYF